MIRYSGILVTLMMFISTTMSAYGEIFATTNIQLLYGTQFDDRFLGNSTSDRKMTTLTVEHFSGWKYGEWAPRLSLSKMLQQDLKIGIVNDFYLAGQLNRHGEGFHAEMIGLGIDLSLPNFSVASLNGYARKDNFNKMTWQLTAFWSVPVGKDVLMDAFTDLYGSDANGMELVSQPQLLFDIGYFLRDSTDNLQWYLQRNNDINSRVPQAMVKWVW